MSEMTQAEEDELRRRIRETPLVIGKAYPEPTTELVEARGYQWAIGCVVLELGSIVFVLGVIAFILATR